MDPPAKAARTVPLLKRYERPVLDRRISQYWPEQKADVYRYGWFCWWSDALAAQI